MAKELINMKKNSRKLVLKSSDFERLQKIIEVNDSPAAELLEAEILGAKIVEHDKLPIDVVAMGSTVRFKRADSQQETVVELVYPEQANVEQKKISILTPVGSALIGLREGGEIDWPMPNGKLTHLQVIAVSQP